jgi:hypothetical protein
MGIETPRANNPEHQDRRQDTGSIEAHEAMRPEELLAAMQDQLELVKESLEHVRVALGKANEEGKAGIIAGIWNSSDELKKLDRGVDSPYTKAIDTAYGQTLVLERVLWSENDIGGNMDKEEFEARLTQIRDADKQRQEARVAKIHADESKRIDERLAKIKGEGQG